MLENVISSFGATRKLPKEDRIGKPFQERIMMAVTEVNGCRYCSYFHTRVALQAGMDLREIRQTLAGDFKDAPQEQLSALYFAQHYADTQGYPSQDAIKCLQDEYGLVKSEAILAYIRAIMVGNAWGNMLDALGKRIRGHSYRDHSLTDELGVIFGPLFMLPSILIKQIGRKIQAKKDFINLSNRG